MDLVRGWSIEKILLRIDCSSRCYWDLDYFGRITIKNTKKFLYKMIAGWRDGAYS